MRRMKRQRNQHSSKCAAQDGSSLQEGRGDVSRSPVRINLEKFVEKSSVGECDIGNLKTFHKESNKISSGYEKKATSNNEDVIKIVSKVVSKDKSGDSIITENVEDTTGREHKSIDERSFIATEKGNEKVNNEVMEGLKQLKSSDTDMVEQDGEIVEEIFEYKRMLKRKCDDEHAKQDEPFYGWSSDTEPRFGMPWVEQDYSRYDLRTSFTLVPSIDNTSLGTSAEATLLVESQVSFSHGSDLTLERENYEEDKAPHEQTVKKEIEDDDEVQILERENYEEDKAPHEQTVKTEIEEDDEVQILKVIPGNPEVQLTSMVSVKEEIKTERVDFDMRSNLGPLQNVSIDRQGGADIMENPRDAIVRDRPHDAIKMDGPHEDNQSSIKIKLIRKMGKWAMHNEHGGNKAKRFRTIKHGENETNMNGESKTYMNKGGEINRYGEGKTNGEDETNKYSHGEDKNNYNGNRHDRAQSERNINSTVENKERNNNLEENVNLKSKDGPPQELTPDGPLNVQKIKSKENLTVKIESAEVSITGGRRTIQMKTTGGSVSGQAGDVNDIVKTLAQVVRDL